MRGIGRCVRVWIFCWRSRQLAEGARGGRLPSEEETLLVGLLEPPGLKDPTERRLRAVSRAGKLAGWLGEHGL